MPILSGLDTEALRHAARRLADDGLVAFATETVYGLGARADHDAAVAGIFSLKGRPVDHPLIVHVLDAPAAAHFGQLTPLSLRLMANCWPGPVSVVVPRRAGVATAAAGGLPTVALRCPAHPVARELLRHCQAHGVHGLAAPSANRFGRTSPTQASHVRDEFGDALTVLDGGPCEAGIESAIVDATGDRPRLLRPGSWSRERLAQLLDAPLSDAGAGPASPVPKVSGSLASHYAPDAAVHLVAAEHLTQWLAQQLAAHGPSSVAVWSRERPAVQGIHWRAMPQAAEPAAQQLFAVLRDWDSCGVSIIGVEQPPRDASWEGVLDRLQRACAPRP